MCMLSTKDILNGAGNKVITVSKVIVVAAVAVARGKGKKDGRNWEPVFLWYQN